jgi:hypothetical protein
VGWRAGAGATAATGRGAGSPALLFHSPLIIAANAIRSEEKSAFASGEAVGGTKGSRAPRGDGAASGMSVGPQCSES